VVGGRGRIAGAVLGALLLVALPEAFGFLDRWRSFAYGAALLAAIVLAPAGLVGMAERLLPAAARPSRGPASEPPAPKEPWRRATLALDGLTKSFGGVRPLDAVSLAVAPGEVVGLIGPNGSGKTTLLNLVSGLYAPDGGAVRLADAELTGLAPHAVARRGVGRSFQTLSLPEDMSGLDAVAVAAGVPPHGGAAALRRARAAAMRCLATMGAAEVASSTCASLPHGMRRRVEIARALATRPAILLLDEPAAGLGPEEQADLARRLRGLAAEGLGLLVVEHNFAFLAGLADRVVCLERGRVIAVGAPEEIRRDPLVLEAYLGAAEPAA
jgi:branched-chain amino acid transport system permease protein